MCHMISTVCALLQWTLQGLTVQTGAQDNSNRSREASTGRISEASGLKARRGQYITGRHHTGEHSTETEPGLKSSVSTRVYGQALPSGRLSLRPVTQPGQPLCIPPTRFHCSLHPGDPSAPIPAQCAFPSRPELRESNEDERARRRASAYLFLVVLLFEFRPAAA